MSQHTLGPWHIDNFHTGTSRHQIVARERLVASIWQHYDRNNKAAEIATDNANARLIAAAPTLERLLRELQPILWNDGPLVKAYRHLDDEITRVLKIVEGNA